MHMPTLATPADRRLVASKEPFVERPPAEAGVRPQGWICGPCQRPYLGRPRCYTLANGRRICINVPITGWRRCCYITSQGRIHSCRTVRC